MGMLELEGLLIVKWSHAGIVLEKAIHERGVRIGTARVLMEWPITEASLAAAVRALDEPGAKV